MELSLKIWALALLGAVLLLMFISRSIKKPLLWLWYGCIYTTCGAVLLFVVNVIGGYFSYHMPLNLFTALVTGILGLPGLAGLVVVQQWLGFF